MLVPRAAQADWETQQVWVTSGEWQNQPIWETSGHWADPVWVTSGEWQNHPYWQSSGYWDNQQNWVTQYGWESDQVWVESGDWEDQGHWESSGEWQVTGGHWEDDGYEEWYCDDDGNWNSDWVSDWEWVDDYSWVDTSQWVSDWEWVDTSHWEDQWFYVDQSHWEDNSVWVDTSGWVDDWSYVDTSHWEDSNQWIDTSHWADNYVWVDTSHWEDQQVWVDDPPPPPPPVAASPPPSTMGTVTLSSYSFDVFHPPTISVGGTPAKLYRLRAKFIDGSQYGFHAATSYFNNGMPLDAVPPPGTYTVALYWLQYNTSFNDTPTVGPENTVTVTVNPSPDPKVSLSSYNAYFVKSTSSVQTGHSLTFLVQATWDVGLNEVGLEQCDESGTPITNLGIVSISAATAYSSTTSVIRSIAWTAPSTPGTYYFRSYAWNTNRSQLVRSDVKTVTVATFDIYSYAEGLGGNYSYSLSNGVTIDVEVTGPDYNGVWTVTVWENGDYGASILHQEKVDGSTGTILSSFDGLSQEDLWGFPSDGSDPYANWDDDDIFNTQTLQDMQEDFVNNLPSDIQSSVAQSFANHHAVELTFSDGTTLLLLPDGVPTGGHVVNGQYIFSDPRSPTQAKYINLGPQATADTTTDDVVRMAPFIVNGNDPATFDWDGFYQWLDTNHIPLPKAADIMAFVSGTHSVAGGKPTGRNGMLGNKYSANNTYPFSQSTNTSCGVNCVRNILQLLNGSCPETETQIAKRMADIVHEPLDEYLETPDDQLNDHHHGTIDGDAQYNTALNKYNIVVGKEGVYAGASNMPPQNYGLLSQYNGLQEFKNIMQTAANAGAVYIAEQKTQLGLFPDHVVVLHPYMQNGTLMVDEIDSGVDASNAKVTTFNLSNSTDLLNAAKVPDGHTNSQGEPNSGYLYPVQKKPPGGG